jgi:hypothetical protein
MRARAGGAAVSIALVLMLWTDVTGGIALAGSGAGPDPAVGEWPHWPYPTVCSGDPFDPVAVFAGPTGAELGSRPSEIALRRFLRKERWAAEYVPTSDWRLLTESSDRAEFASGRLSSSEGPGTMSFEFKHEQWEWSGLSSDCDPTSVVDGIQAISWRLATDQDGRRKNWKSLWINLGPGECAGGRSQNARALKPIFEELEGKLLVIMRLRPLPPGGYTCEGRIEPPLKIRLPSRLGHRKVFDGSTYPPADVVGIWRREIRRHR